MVAPFVEMNPVTEISIPVDAAEVGLCTHSEVSELLAGRAGGKMIVSISGLAWPRPARDAITAVVSRNRR